MYSTSSNGVNIGHVPTPQSKILFLYVILEDGWSSNTTARIPVAITASGGRSYDRREACFAAIVLSHYFEVMMPLLLSFPILESSEVEQLFVEPLGLRRTYRN